MKSFDVINSVLQTFKDQAIIIFANGRLSTEALHLKDSPNHFYMLGSMGCASSIGLGIAIAKKNHKVVVVDGDGNILMNPSSLITIGSLKPSNLLHLVIDNGIYETTGGQSTINKNWRPTNFAKNCGYNFSKQINMDEIEEMKNKLFNNEGPIFGKIDVEPGMMKGAPTFKKSPIDIKKDIQKIMNS